MNFFKLTEEQIAVREMVKEAVDKKIRPAAADYDRDAQFPVENVKLLADMGILSLPYGEEYGGAGTDFLTYALCIEEVAKACASTASVMESHFGAAETCVNMFGTKEQKEKYMPVVVKLFCNSCG